MLKWWSIRAEFAVCVHACVRACESQQPATDQHKGVPACSAVCVGTISLPTSVCKKENLCACRSGAATHSVCCAACVGQCMLLGAWAVKLAASHLAAGLRTKAEQYRWCDTQRTHACMYNTLGYGVGVVALLHRTAGHIQHTYQLCYLLRG